MKQIINVETDEVQIRVKEPLHGDFKKALIAARVVISLKLTPIKPKKNEVTGKNKKHTFQKSARNELGERAILYDFLRILASALAGIQFGLIVNGDVKQCEERGTKNNREKLQEKAVEFYNLHVVTKLLNW